MHGGLILKNPELTGCQPLIHLIKFAHNIQFVANTGTGILFRLIVGNDKTVYQNASGVNVNSFIIKIVIITDGLIEYRLGERSDKKTETFTDFLKESRVQQQIWKDCIKQGLPEFTPSVANLSIFDNSQSQFFLNLLLSRNNELFPPKDYKPTQINVLISAVIAILTKNTQSNIGVLLMPDITNTITLGTYLENNKQYIDKIQKAYVNTIVNVLRLYLFHDIIHLDLHSGNVLISRDENASSFIIDFGYITNSESKQKSELNQKSESNNNNPKRKRSERKEDLDTVLDKDKNKFQFVDGIIQIVKNIFENKNKGSKIRWIEEIDQKNNRNPGFKNQIFLNAFDELKNIYAIQNEKSQCISSDKIFNLDRDEKKYYCDVNMLEDPKSEVPKRDGPNSDFNPFCQNSNKDCQDNGKGCTISGGKRRTYVSKRKKKPKKTRKTQKSKKTRKTQKR